MWHVDIASSSFGSCIYLLKECEFFVSLEIVACFCFFFQAEDGIRDVAVTGVQTCALRSDTGVYYKFYSVINNKGVQNVDCIRQHSIVIHPCFQIIFNCAVSRYKITKVIFRHYIYIDISSSRIWIQIGRASCRERVQIAVVAVA